MQANSLQQWLTPFAIQLPASVAALPLQHLRINSSEVQKGDVFLALPGTKTHGNQFIEKALAAGAVVVLTDAAPAVADERIVVVPKLVELLSALAAAFYPHQAQQLVGITGTNGKSSTAIFVNQLAVLLEKQAAVIGTLGYGDYRNLTPLNNTTPHLVDIHRILSTEAAKGCSLVAMEVSYHALVQQRVAGLQFEVAVFTNLTRDHLDYHGTMQAYGEAKALLFKADLAKKAVINVSDDFGRQLAADCTLPVLAYGQLLLLYCVVGLCGASHCILCVASHFGWLSWVWSDQVQVCATSPLWLVAVDMVWLWSHISPVPPHPVETGT